MRFFELLHIQHAAALIIVALIFMVVFAVGLGFIPLSGRPEKTRKIKAVQHFADGIGKGDGPYPLVIALIIAGVVFWALFYILFYGFSEVIL
ncbi:MAG: hypothetical protein ACQETC_10555 [Thermodesulfobacteriota bacterium]